MSGSVTATLIVPLLIGIVAGLRAMTAPAAVSWAARLGSINVAPTGFAFLAWTYTPWILTLLALGEFVTDQLPTTPSRTVPVQFAARLVTGGLSGAAIGSANGSFHAGLIAGVIGAVIGTLGGRQFRGALAKAFGNDHPAAFIEDAVAIAVAALALGVLL